MKCINVSCDSEQSSIKGIKGNFCIKCLQSREPFRFACVQCGKVFEKYALSSMLPKYCSRSCRNKKLRKRTESTHIPIYERVSEMLKHGAYTNKQIADITGCGKDSVVQIIYKLRKKHTILCRHGYYFNITYEG